MACSIREPILVTLETSSSENPFFSRSLRNLSPNSPTTLRPGEAKFALHDDDDGIIIGQAEWMRHNRRYEAGSNSARKSDLGPQLVLSFRPEPEQSDGAVEEPAVRRRRQTAGSSSLRPSE